MRAGFSFGIGPLRFWVPVGGHRRPLPRVSRQEFHEIVVRTRELARARREARRCADSHPRPRVPGAR